MLVEFAGRSECNYSLTFGGKHCVTANASLHVMLCDVIKGPKSMLVSGRLDYTRLSNE